MTISTKKKLLFTLIIWLVIFGLLEATARIYYWSKAERKARESEQYNRAAMFIPHPYCTYVGNPEYPGHTPQGFRGSVVYGREHKAFRIVCLGGSSTYDTQVSEPDSYPRQLEGLLAKELPQGVEVINAGLGGYCTANIIPLLSLRIVELKPQLAIFYVGFNDAFNRIHYADFKWDYTHAQKSWEMPRVPLWRRSRALDRAAEMLGSPSPYNPHVHMVCWNPLKGDPVENWKNSSGEPFRNNLVTLVGICRAHGITPVFCTQATDFQNHPVEGCNDVWAQAMGEQMCALRQVMAELKVDVIDVAVPMSNKSDYFADCLHMTKEGNVERARIIAAYLKEHGLLRPQGD